MKYRITVKTGTSQEKVVAHPDGMLTVYLRAKPHDGEANVALIRLLSKHLHISKASIHIKSGVKSHHKIIQID